MARTKKRKRVAQDEPVEHPTKKNKNPTKESSANTATKPLPLDTSPFLDNPDLKGADYRREVQAYDKLANEDDALRLGAATTIVLGLLGGEGVDESTLQRHLERRLFRGLASGRKAARLGFSVVITEILRELFGEKRLAETKYAGLTFDKVLGILVAKTKPDGDLSGQEERDHFFGLLFGLQCFVKANILFSDSEKWSVILEKLFDLSKKKPWLREECGSVVEKAVTQMNISQAELTLEQLFNAGLALSPEGVGIWLTVRNKFPDLKFPTKPWGPTGNPLDRLQSLAKALKESSRSEQGSSNAQAKQPGNWNPHLHFVWDIVLSQFSNALKEKKKDIKSSFENFWKVAVDENLFSTTASRERKYWGFLLFQKVLQSPESYSKLFPYIFSHNLVRCLINHSQDTDRFLHRSAEKSLKVLSHTVENNPKTMASILPCLITRNGAYHFDKMTKTKTVEMILSSINETNAKEVIDILLAPAVTVDGSDIVKEAETRRIMFGDYLLNMIRKVNMDEDSAGWIADVALPILGNFAYGTSITCSPPLSEKTRTVFRSRLSSVFTHLILDLNGYKYPCGLLHTLSPGAVGMDREITKTKNDAISTMEKILKKIKKAKEEDTAPLQALALLYSLVIFQLYNAETEAVSILDELKLCYDTLVRHKDTEDSDVEAAEVLVELLLSFISKPSALLRKVTQHVFQAFMIDMTEGGLKLMTDVLESSESLRGQQELFDQQPGDGMELDDEEGSDDGDEMDSDVEVIDVADQQLNGHLIEEGEDSEESENQDEDEEDSESDSEADIQNDEEVKSLNDALAKALGTHPLDVEGGAGSESDSDADMTDSEMMALDSKLVEIFSQRKKQPNKKQEQKDAKETIINFKSRVLDLLDIYVRKQAGNPLALGLLLPLLKLIRTTTTKTLGDKAIAIVSTFHKASNEAHKSPDAPDIDSEEQLSLLKAVHLEARKEHSLRFGKAASTASLLLVNNLYRTDKDGDILPQIYAIYAETSIAWVRKEVDMPAEFQQGWLNWCQSKAKAQTNPKPRTAGEAKK